MIPIQICKFRSHSDVHQYFKSDFKHTLIQIFHDRIISKENLRLRSEQLILFTYSYSLLVSYTAPHSELRTVFRIPYVSNDNGFGFVSNLSRIELLLNGKLRNSS